MKGPLAFLGFAAFVFIAADEMHNFVMIACGDLCLAASGV
jgi:hypothetical protein